MPLPRNWTRGDPCLDCGGLGSICGGCSEAEDLCECGWLRDPRACYLCGGQGALNHFHLTAEEVGDRIGIPPDQWKGRCYEIATEMLRAGVVEGKARYGNWVGPIESGSVFSNRLFAHHGWVELEDGEIVDPTRWVFETADPYIFHGRDEDDYYDRTGDRIRKAFRSPPPEFDPEDRKCDLLLPPGVGAFFKSVLGDHPYWTVEQIHWAANLSLEELGEHAQPFYEALEGTTFKAFVPIDNYRLVMDG